jgi:ppGpp synthetase/RelA/SpoT-type nucleotidyltranferase
MKLAEALVLRADVQKRIVQLSPRLRTNAVVQEGDQPSELPETLLAELDTLLAQLEDLILRINRTNIQARLSDGTSLTAALARRDVLAMRLNALTVLADTAGNRVDRYGSAEIRKLATVDVAAVRRQVDDLARQRRELDTAIQAANWTVDLVE